MSDVNFVLLFEGLAIALLLGLLIMLKRRARLEVRQLRFGLPRDRAGSGD